MAKAFRQIFSPQALLRMGRWMGASAVALHMLVTAGVSAAGVPQLHTGACANCGVVESISQAQRDRLPSGLGALAGAVLGSLVAKEVGGKDGQTLATIIGFLGGMWAGHVAEKQYNGQIVYTVSVRMDDGSLRTVEQTTPVAVGTHVSMDGNVLTPVAVPAVAASHGMV